MRWMNWIFSILIFQVVDRSARSEYLSPDSKKIYHDITAGRGLYTDFNRIDSLNANDFKATIFNNTKNNAWVVEFYNSWCGHCHRFAPVWKQFALDTYGWRDVVSLGAVDCSNSGNTPLCRDYEVMFYPMLKYFPPLPSNDFLGTPVKTGTVEELMNSVLKILRDDAIEGSINKPLLLPFNGRSIKSLWDNNSADTEYIVLIIQKNDTFVGEALALDTATVPKIKVLKTLNTNTDLVATFDTSNFPAMYIIDKKHHIENLNIANASRQGVYDLARSHLLGKGIHIPELTIEKVPEEGTINVGQMMALMEIEEQIKKKLHLQAMTDVVFQIDVENALRHSLSVEVPSHKSISGEAMTALKSYVQALVDYFPIGKTGKDFLKSIQNQINNKNDISGSDFGNIVTTASRNNSPYLSPDSGWLSCRGSLPKYRGYPCGLWTMFHTLTVHADVARASDSKQVLRAMLAYVKNFFGCTDCSKHFQAMAVTMEDEVSSVEDSVLWLWEAHNKVNKRLMADPSEDPKHLKTVFPPQNLCKGCYLPTGAWNQPGVLAFLRSMYTNISYFLVEDLPPLTSQQTINANSLRHDNMAEDKGFNYSHSDSKQMNFNFNVFDVSICVLLYVFSMVIIILVCLKFLYKRTFRKKAYIYDIFQRA